MSIEVKTPTLPESVADALIVNWFKKPSDSVTADEPLLELETDKVVLEVPAPETGVLESIVEEVGASVVGEQLLAYINVGAAAGSASVETSQKDDQSGQDATAKQEPVGDASTSPSVRKALRENDLSAKDVAGSGKKGRILKEDVAAAAKAQSSPVQATQSAPTTVNEEGRVEERVPMSRLRKTIAKRLVDATATTAMLTTFNEVNMQPLMEMRAQYKALFEKTHEVRLGFMSMFVKAATVALEKFPDVNASIDGDDIVYHGYSDIGIAVSSPRGLVVPILRNTENMSFAEIESGIAKFAEKAREGKLGLEEMQGGTFTITNGGVFGSLLSTPILNPPQSAILGMHGINKRVVVEDDEMVIRPMMYLALSYDHRIIDGQSAVLFLKTIKELVEDPHRILLEV